MRHLRLLESAEADLRAIFFYVLETSGDVGTAERFVRALRDQCANLASLPGLLGRSRTELRPDIRSFPFRRYIIFFRYTDDAFEVVNVLEGHRDLAAHFKDNEEA